MKYLFPCLDLIHGFSPIGVYIHALYRYLTMASIVSLLKKIDTMLGATPSRGFTKRVLDPPGSIRERLIYFDHNYFMGSHYTCELRFIGGKCVMQCGCTMQHYECLGDGDRDRMWSLISGSEMYSNPSGTVFEASQLSFWLKENPINWHVFTVECAWNLDTKTKIPLNIEFTETSRQW
jgi:hypothetical protein